MNVVSGRCKKRASVLGVVVLKCAFCPKIGWNPPNVCSMLHYSSQHAIRINFSCIYLLFFMFTINLCAIIVKFMCY